MPDIVIIRKDTGEYLIADPPHPRSWDWDDPNQFFTDDIENAATFGTAVWSDRYIHRCPPLCTLADENSIRDHEYIVAYGMRREQIGNNLPIGIVDPA